jgi:hypothetical protein
MSDTTAYLKNSMGLDITESAWSGAESLPLFLRSGITIRLCQAHGAEFLLAEPAAPIALPDVKRIHSQLSRYAPYPVVLSLPFATARQRHALVAQHIPFICTGKQASLPFLGAASTEWGKKSLEQAKRAKLSWRAQQAAIWGALHDAPYTSQELQLVCGMSASQASQAKSTLIRNGLASPAKKDGTACCNPISEQELLEHHMELLSTPVLKRMTVRRSDILDMLPDAGESALSAVSSLIPPRIAVKAASRTEESHLIDIAVLQGELPDKSTAIVEIWKYPPLFADANAVDPISLALSLAVTSDERIELELARLFGREYPWQKAL